MNKIDKLKKLPPGGTSADDSAEEMETVAAGVPEASGRTTGNSPNLPKRDFDILQFLKDVAPALTVVIFILGGLSFFLFQLWTPLLGAVKDIAQLKIDVDKNSVKLEKLEDLYIDSLKEKSLPEPTPTTKP